jgi:hypothetical protein
MGQISVATRDELAVARAGRYAQWPHPLHSAPARWTPASSRGGGRLDVMQAGLDAKHGPVLTTILRWSGLSPVPWRSR